MIPAPHPVRGARGRRSMRVAVQQPEQLARRCWRRRRGIRAPTQRVLPDDHGQLLLVIDQFEELFTLRPTTTSGAASSPASRVAATDPRSQAAGGADHAARRLLRPAAALPASSASCSSTASVIWPPLAARRAGAGDRRARPRASACVRARLVVRDRRRRRRPAGRAPAAAVRATELFERRDADDADGRRLRAPAASPAPSPVAPTISTASSTRPSSEAARQVFLRLVTVSETARGHPPPRDRARAAQPPARAGRRRRGARPLRRGTGC